MTRNNDNWRIRKDQLDIEESETDNIKSLERYTSTTTNPTDNTDNSGLLSSSSSSSFREHNNNNNKNNFSTANRFRNVARRASLLEQVSETRRLLRHHDQKQQHSNGSTSKATSGHSTAGSGGNAVTTTTKKKGFAPRDILQKFRTRSESHLTMLQGDTNTYELQKLFMEDDDLTTTVEEEEDDDSDDEQNRQGMLESSSSMESTDDIDDNNQHVLPFLLHQSNSHYGSMMAAEVQHQRSRTLKKKKSLRYQISKWWKGLIVCHGQNPKDAVTYWCRRCMKSLLLLVAVPLFILSLVLYYWLGDPTVPIILTSSLRNSGIDSITISWWCNFFARQVVSYELAQLMQWLVLDVFVSATVSAHLLGPYITLFALQSRGVPFLIGTWGFLNILLLRGTTSFHDHWFYWTGWKIYSEATSGDAILSSDLYLRILLSMVLIGWATTFKRSVVTTRFGRQLLAEFQPRMEVLLADIVLMNEIAVLAEQVGAAADVFDHTPPASNIARKGSNNILQQQPPSPAAGAASSTTNIASTNSSPSLSLSLSSSNPLLSSPEVQTSSSGLTDEEIPWANVNRTRDESTELMHDLSENDKKSTDGGRRRSQLRSSSLERRKGYENLEQNSNGGFAIKDLLDQWDDPVEALSVKSKNSTIQDVLRFKRALGYMDEPRPFGDAFGPASNRDEAIESAHHVFWDLTKFDDATAAAANSGDVSTSNRVLNFDLLSLISMDERGEIIPAKHKALKKLFRPDARNELSLLAFVQSCDNVYKRLRFFRASVSNSSAIDQVLENIMNCIFGFVLILLILEILNFDPWTLLLSMTSLLVSVSFALGSSTSQFVEGLLLIAGRRPFDLGDRILIIGSESQDKPSPTESYFVEDISLLKTTVRFARTNEVSTINNFSISKSRIVNLQRSSNAIIYIEMKFDTLIFENDNLSKYRTFLEDYLKENTRSWECINFIRHDEIDADCCYVLVRFSFRHRYSWQYASRIMLNRADLVRYMYEKGVELSIHWMSTIPIRAIYEGGTIEDNHLLGRRVGTNRRPFNKYISDKAD